MPAESNAPRVIGATNEYFRGFRVMNACNLLYVINDLRMGGAQVGMARLLNGLDDERYDVTVVTIDGYDKTFVEQRLPTVESILDCKRVRTPRDVSRLVSAVASADVIVGSLYHASILTRVAGVVNRDATVATWHHNERFKTLFREMLFKTTSPLSDVVLADSEPVAKILCGELGLADDVVESVPIAGIPLSEFEPREHDNTGPITVGSVGVISGQKNFRNLVSMAVELEDEDVIFRIVGDGPEKETIACWIETIGVENIELLGSVRELPTFLNSVDIYVQPSRFEGLCITVVEAMAAGLPIVGSAVGGIRHNVRNGKCGYVHDPDDIEGFCRSIRELAANPSKRQRFGDHGREYVEQHYSQRVLVEEFEQAIHRPSR
ncbi:glycosyltransferase family 4 protein [Natrarchaeobius sp. A-rgal3]|uniref:glycosyltransferase family 4 protein n=1 Tax=Natrarchaeobius versutus TaxID=1679078 RepID=UPI00350EB5BD